MISAKIIKDSIAPNGKRLTTFELEYPRFIHSEFNTHRMLSRNAASSRAIPVSTMIKMVWNNPACPVHWGKNQSGMQAKEELTGFKLSLTKFLWKLSGKVCCMFAYLLNEVGCHKQIVNRIIEPWSYIKVVASATEWDNFFYLRNHPDAQPEIHELARVMLVEYNKSIPNILKEGEWHLPYVGKEYNIVDNVEMWTAKYDRTFRDYLSKDGTTLISLQDAIKLSASLCAQVSYRKADESIEKAIKIYDRLITSKPCHASPFEHQATPAKSNIVISGNFRGWKQHRQDIAGNVCKKYNN
jgi:thymidylate synthase ThyX